jgi:enamine deaminase RidA (YjgF/YER057c/UK114 family)
VEIERHGSGGPYEDHVGYARVVRAGPHVWVSGCTSVGPDGVVHGGADPGEQMRLALQSLTDALARVGAGVEDVVRTRMYVTDISRWEDVGRAHGDVFRDVRPATAMVQVTAFIDRRMLVEIEADAFVRDATSG